MRKRLLATSIAALSAIAAAQAPAESPEIDSITVVHPACESGCPTYRLEVSREGVVHYDGLGYVKVFGKRTWTIPEQEAAKLVRTAAETELVPSTQNAALLLTEKGACDPEGPHEGLASVSLRTADSAGFPAEVCYSPKVRTLADAVEDAAGVSIYATGEDAQAQKAIRAVLDSQVEAWNKGDLEGYMRGYWRSPELTFFSGASETSGWKQTLDRYRKAYKSEGKQMGKLSFSNVRIEMLSPDAAFVRGEWKLDMTGGQQPHGVYTLIFRKTPDGWRIVHDHSSGS